MTYQTIEAVLTNAHACAVGFVSRERMLTYLDDAAREQCEALCPGWQTVVCAAWSYYVADPDPLPVPHLCRYARGTDYHTVLRQQLSFAVTALEAEGYRAVPTADVSPLPEVRAAMLAGLGQPGRNGLLLVPGYGSWIFLGTLLTDAKLDAPEREAPRLCTDCGACRKACPTGILNGQGRDCLSAITQRPGALTPAEEALIRESGCFWGCDVCQAVCPVNRKIAETTVPAFREGLLYTIPRETVEDCSRRALLQRFPDRAFTWKGPAVLRRNLALFAEKNAPAK